MSEAKDPATAPPLDRPPFQFTLRTLFLVFVVLASSLGVFGAWGVLVFGVILGIATILHFQGPAMLAVLVVIILCLMCILFLPAVESAKESGRRAWCSNNMKQLALSLKEYEMAHGAFPPAYVADKSGKPMHSWRTLILPYLDSNSLYITCDLTKPWNGPKNKAFSTTPVSFYSCSSDRTSRTMLQTNYVAVTGPNTAWDGDKPKKLADFGGEAANTILVIEVRNSGIEWAEPRDLSLEALESNDAAALAPSSNHGPHSDFFFIYDDIRCANAAMADGSVRFLPPGSLTPERLPKLLQIGGCKQSELDLLASGEPNRRPNWPNIAALAVWLISVIVLLTRSARSRPRVSRNEQ